MVLDANTLTLLGAILITPALTLLTLWIKSASSKEARRDARDDSYLKTLIEQVKGWETRAAELEKEIKEIRAELKLRDEEYVSLYKEHTTIRAKYDVLLGDHNDLRAEYEKTVKELEALKETIKQDRQITSTVAGATAGSI